MKVLFLVNPIAKKIQGGHQIQLFKTMEFLRKINAENDYKCTQKEHANEKAVLEFKHTITTLEEKINDGTKNQVVAKLEALKNKREQHLKRVNLG